MKAIICTLLLVFTSCVYSYSDGSCAPGMSSTVAGCSCLAGHVNKTSFSSGCDACPAGTYAKIITRGDPELTNIIVIDSLLAHLTAGLEGIQQATGVVMSDAQKEDMRETVKTSLLEAGEEEVRTQFMTMFENHHMCAECGANTYSSSAATSCVSCQMYSSSVNGSGMCHCEAGFDHASNGICTACSDCTTQIKFDVTLEMDETKFVGVMRDEFKHGVAMAIAIKTSDVVIGEVKPKIALRRLLSAGPHIIVSTTITVSDGAANEIQDMIRQGVIIPALSQHDITATMVSPPVIEDDLIDEIVPFPMWFIIGLACVGLVFLLGTAYVCIRFAVRHKKTEYTGDSQYMQSEAPEAKLLTTEAYNTSLQVDGFMNTLHQTHVKPESNGTSVVLSRPRFWGL